KGYGYNMMVFDPRKINFSRAAPTVNDYGRPFRSMLLVLQALLTGVPEMNGEHAGDFKDRLRLFDDILLHTDANRGVDGRANPGQRLASQLEQELKDVDGEQFYGAPAFESNKTVLELHVFGPVVVERDVLATMLSTGYAPPSGPVKDNKQL